MNQAVDTITESQPVAFRIEPHDSNQLELKLAYLMKPGVDKQQYTVETFLFAPRTLGLDRHTYRTSRFYEETAVFLRYKTPIVTLDALADPTQAIDWFDPIVQHLESLEGGALASEECIRRLKLLGCIYRSAIRDRGPVIIEALTEQQSVGSVPPAVQEYVRHFSANIQRAQSRLRELGKHCELGSDALVRDAWYCLDEYVALITEDISTEVVAALDQVGTKRQDPTRTLLAQVAVDAYHYRRDRGYPSFAHPDDDNEELPYRRRILKRILSSVLYLDVRNYDAGRWAHDLIGMMAAAAAMLFAVLVAIWAQVSWEFFSLPFVLIMVISYMIKDRIKEWGKRYLGKRFYRWIPDKVMKIIDHTGNRTVGRCRESVRLMSPSKVEEAILRLRHTHDNRVAEDGRPETVVHYVKQVTLYSQRLNETIEGFEGVNDIIRFNLSSLRGRMDAPIENVQMIHPRTHELLTVSCPRVYHVNLVLRVTAGDKSDEIARLERIRIVLDQNGIKRVEAIHNDHEPSLLMTEV
jgi:hypothetical protein